MTCQHLLTEGRRLGGMLCQKSQLDDPIGIWPSPDVANRPVRKANDDRDGALSSWTNSSGWLELFLSRYFKSIASAVLF